MGDVFLFRDVHWRMGFGHIQFLDRAVAKRPTWQGISMNMTFEDIQNLYRNMKATHDKLQSERSRLLMRQLPHITTLRGGLGFSGQPGQDTEPKTAIELYDAIMALDPLITALRVEIKNMSLTEEQNKELFDIAVRYGYVPGAVCIN